MAKDISNVATTNVIGFDAQGGLSTSADGEFGLQNDAGTNVFTIDVDGSAELQVVDNEISLPVGDSLSVYNVGGPGDVNYERLRMYWDSNTARLGIEPGGTGSVNRTFSIYVNGNEIFRWNKDGITTLKNIAAINSGVASLGNYNKPFVDLASTSRTLVDVSSDPSDPGNGSSVMWQSDGTGSGDDGDIMVKITDSGGTTKTVTLIDYSAS